MFVILQKYDFSSKSQHNEDGSVMRNGCLWYCKSTIFQANHNGRYTIYSAQTDVCDTAKVRFFKQITTQVQKRARRIVMFVILQKYDFSSKSQQPKVVVAENVRCLWYCKSTIFQANHNSEEVCVQGLEDVCDTAKVRFFKQITTYPQWTNNTDRCLWYCKSTIFQANHNRCVLPNNEVVLTFNGSITWVEFIFFVW